MFLPPPVAPTQILAHYMPWYSNKVVSGRWGWHWTMDRFDPEKSANGRTEAASHYRPLIGLYDSGDPQAIECHVLLMKFAGIDGVLVDWYGNVDHLDYLSNHRNTERIFAVARRAGLKFGLVYEDQTVPRLIEGGKFRAQNAVSEGKRLMHWVDRNWFASSGYLRDRGRPLFLVFGPQFYKPEEWTEMFEGLSIAPAFYTLHNRKSPAIGAYDWPSPQGGSEGARRARLQFYARQRDGLHSIPVAYPRFHDVYGDAGLPHTYDRVEDADGAIYETTLTEALSRKSQFAQIATWNDWGEGTMVEPSEEFGYRDLETTQRLRKRFLGGGRAFTAADLRLPVRLYRLQKRFAGDSRRRAKLAGASRMLFEGKLGQSRTSLDELDDSR